MSAEYACEALGRYLLQAKAVSASRATIVELGDGAVFQVLSGF